MRHCPKELSNINGIVTMAKVIVEIDGIRHRKVNGRMPKTPIERCQKCSLIEVCCEKIGSPCLRDKYDYFVLEKSNY